MNEWERKLDGDLGEILFDQETISKRVRELAAEITRDYQSIVRDELVIIGILRGSVLFMSDLIRFLSLPVTIDFMAVSSYTKGTKTSGTVRILKDISESIAGKQVLVVEDIVDTGLTLENLTAILSARQPAGLKICTLLDKPSRRLPQCNLKVDYVGFTIPDKFVVGYGLDYNDHYRQLPFVGVLKPEAYS